jgi:hypothetical protein
LRQASAAVDAIGDLPPDLLARKKKAGNRLSELAQVYPLFVRFKDSDARLLGVPARMLLPDEERWLREFFVEEISLSLSIPVEDAKIRLSDALATVQP